MKTESLHHLNKAIDLQKYWFIFGLLQRFWLIYEFQMFHLYIPNITICLNYFWMKT